MNLFDLQDHLKNTGRYSGRIDGLWGRLTSSAILLMMTDGPDTALTEADFQAAAQRLAAPVRNIKAVTQVEAPGSGFQAGLPKILPEPHRFSRNTNHRFDRDYPTLSYPNWGARPYPATQDARYDMLLAMVRLDVDAGFASASYGRFQIMGENAAMCGYASSMAFAEAMARDEKTQLRAFEAFVTKRGLLPALRKISTNPADCVDFARGYNGTGFAKQNYHGKIAAAVR